MMTYYFCFCFYLLAFAECANHGVCARYQGGKCTCEPGYRGIACDDTSDAGSINETVHAGPFFTGNLVKWQMKGRTPSKDFYLWTAQIEGENVTSLRGDQWLRHRGALSVELGSSGSRGSKGGATGVSILQLGDRTHSEAEIEELLRDLPTANVTTLLLLLFLFLFVTL